MKFKKGDRVKLIADDPQYEFGPNVRQYDIGVVNSYRSGGHIFVDFPNHDHWHGLDDKFELAEAEEKEETVSLAPHLSELMSLSNK